MTKMIITTTMMIMTYKIKTHKTGNYSNNCYNQWNEYNNDEDNTIPL